MAADTTTPRPRHATASAHAVGIKETIISLLIAFALAFVFRGYVIEPFLIPTGSMAPTLLGAHERFVHPDTGYDWAVGPWYHEKDKLDRALPRQGGRYKTVDLGPITVNDPMSRQPWEMLNGVPSRSGDRIFVLKYVWPFFKPHRYDCIVFKNPGNTQDNYIKRLIGLPGENVALIDGDVFVRKADQELDSTTDAWKLDGWDIAPKPELVQRNTWQRVFDSSYTPLNAPNFVPPFTAGTEGWDINGKPAYAYTGKGAGTLWWTSAQDGFDFGRSRLEHLQKRQVNAGQPASPPAGFSPWSAATLMDVYPFNQTTGRMPNVADFQASGPQGLFFPVSDLRLSVAFEPAAAGETYTAVVRARGHEFRGRLAPGDSGSDGFVEMRPAPTQASPDPEWKTLAQGHTSAVPAPGRPAIIDFWHADQTLQLWVEGELVAKETYHWTPVQRIEFAMARNYDDLMGQDQKERENGACSPLSFGANYTRPELWLEVSGPATLHRVAVWRDLFYTPAPRNFQPSYPSYGTHPLTTVALNGEEFFVCGDNSPSSSDARLWDRVDPWVAAEIDDKIGVVPERLLIGKAFFVYFPSLQPRQVGGSTIPVPDAGRLRWIW